MAEMRKCPWLGRDLFSLFGNSRQLIPANPTGTTNTTDKSEMNIGRSIRDHNAHSSIATAKSEAVNERKGMNFEDMWDYVTLL